MIKHTQKIHVAGCGLVGSILGLRLLQKGYDVELYESRPDMRTTEISAGRSINLALSHRGIQALNMVGMEKEMLTHAIPMHGRMVHELSGELKFQPYSSRQGEFINSISRRSLNVLLMDAIEKIKPAAIHFNHKLTAVEKEGKAFIVENERKESFRLDNGPLIATDGAGSLARKWMLDQTPWFHFDYSQRFQNYGYKELTIPPGKDGSFRIEKNALHIWPRGHFMMIALPNPDATYTATLFLPYEGQESFSNLKDIASVRNFYKKFFPDSLDLLPELETEFFEHPTGYLYTVKCMPWNYKDRILLMGDAAHAIIPFYGQGMNCGFEDVFVFDQLLDKHDDLLKAFEEFSKLRKPNGDAIADLAEDNFIEMRDKVADPLFQKKRKLEMLLEKTFPDYYSKYAMVTFRPDLGYHEAMVRGRAQDDLLMTICSEGREDWDALSLKAIYDKLMAIR